MKMKLRYVLSGILIILWIGASAQIKIGDNPQNIDPASILELESTSRAFVINRVTTAQMNAIVPLEGAMVYNTDIQCLHYYDGENWLNLCEALGLTITNNPIKYLPDTTRTISLVRTGNNINIEVDSIRSNRIAYRTIRQDDVGGSAINGLFHIQNRSIPIGKLGRSSAAGQIIKSDAARDPQWVTPAPAVVAFGKVNGSTLQNASFGISSIFSLGAGYYQVNLQNPRITDGYTIQLTVSGDNRIYVDFQTFNSFFVQVKRYNTDDPVVDASWYITVFDN